MSETLLLTTGFQCDEVKLYSELVFFQIIVTALCIVLLLATPSFSKHKERGGTRSGHHRSSSGHRSRSGHSSNEYRPRICGYLRRVECNELSNPTNGTVAYMERGFEDIATYSCSDGFDLAGCSTRTCLSNGTWSGAPPTCDFRGKTF